MQRSVPAVLISLLSVAHAGAMAGGTQPRWLHETLGLPEWLTLSVEQRTRYESVDGQFRAAGSGGDQIAAFRTLARLDATRGSFSAGAEFIDSRVALDDRATPVDTAQVDEIELLQAWLGWRGEDLPGGISATLRIGRQTMDFGSRRLIARNGFRNTINTFTGADLVLAGSGGWQWRGFFALPVSRLPSTRPEIDEHDVEFDDETGRIYLTGLFFSHARLFPGAQAEFHVFHLHEDDTARIATRNRELTTPGLRVVRAPATGRIDFEVEAAWQFGTGRATTAATDVHDLDHFAFFGHAQMGYSFAAPWAPRVVVQYDYASGDDDPLDGDNGTFDPLFGARRVDFGPTGIWGPFARANISTPGCRLMLKPAPAARAMIAHRFYWLADARAAWIPAQLADRTGKSGRWLGQQIELSAGWEPIPGRVDLEGGFARFFKGGFAQNVPGAPATGDGTYVYTQVTLKF